jgi:hypothetical protein
MKTEEVDAATFLRAFGKARPSRQRAKRAGPDVPRAPADERVGLNALMAAGWMPSFDAARNAFMLHKGDVEAGWFRTLKEACDAAKVIEKASKG